MSIFLNNINSFCIDNIMESYYQILGLSPGASEKDIKKSYRKLALQYHPDKNKQPGTEEKFKQISEAYQMLTPIHQRKTYNKIRFSDNILFIKTIDQSSFVQKNYLNIFSKVKILLNLPHFLRMDLRLDFITFIQIKCHKCHKRQLLSKMGKKLREEQKSLMDRQYIHDVLLI